jgi:S-(hydroxymethyl)glutathione dehydrogenase / alcohol dehydrogenase
VQLQRDISNNAQVRIGESVLVYGSGGIGLNIVQAAHLASANPIIAIDKVDAKLELAKSLGATHVINSSKTDVAARVEEIMGHTRGVDVAIDNTGNPGVIAECYALTQAKGKTILVGVVPKGSEITIYPLGLHFGKTLTGSHGGECNPSIDIPNYIRLHQSGKLNLESLITDWYPLDDINTAIHKMATGQIIGRCMVSISK